jgi:hypothetical protein
VNPLTAVPGPKDHETGTFVIPKSPISSNAPVSRRVAHLAFALSRGVMRSRNRRSPIWTQGWAPTLRKLCTTPRKIRKRIMHGAEIGDGDMLHAL